MPKAILATLALLPVPLLATAGRTEPVAAATADVRASAEGLLRSAYPADGPGAAAIIMKGGQVVYAGGRGLSDLALRRPITTASLFKLGSITKQFTAAVVLQLVAEGRISLDDPIARFFPDFPLPTSRATVRQLLNHSSGVQDYSKIPGWMTRAGDRAWTTAELVAVVRDTPAKSQPGEAWEYNNAGYTMLGAIVEKVTGRPWHEAVEQRIARPLGLTSVQYVFRAESQPAFVRGYTLADGRPVPAHGVHMSLAHAAGGLVGTVGDLGRWAQALHHGRVVGQAQYAEMTRPARLKNGQTRPYGFGLRLQRFLDQTVYMHGGAGAGLDAESIYIPSEDLFVAVLSNSDSPAAEPGIVARRLAALAMGTPFPTFAQREAAPGTLEPLFGTYAAEGLPVMRFFGRAGRPFLAYGDQELEAIPAGDDRFLFGPERLMWIAFTRPSAGAPLLELHEPETARPWRAVRTGAVPPPITISPAVLKSYVGTYRTEVPTVTVELDTDGGLTLRLGDGRPVLMRPISDTEFRLDAERVRVVFQPEGGRVDKVTLYRGARELHGVRIQAADVQP